MSLGSLLSKLAGAGSGEALPTAPHDEFARIVKDASCAIVDVREPHEYAAGHVPGAINLPLSRFDAAMLPQGRCVLICQAGGRSGKALTQALHAGRTDVRHYAPGTGGWRAGGGAIEG